VHLLINKYIRVKLRYFIEKLVEHDNNSRRPITSSGGNRTVWLIPAIWCQHFLSGLCLRYLPRYYRVSNAAALLTPILFLGNERTRVTFGVTAILFEYRNSIGALLRYFVSIAKVSPRYCDTLWVSQQYWRVTSLLYEYRKSIAALLRYFMSIAKVLARYFVTIWVSQKYRRVTHIKWSNAKSNAPDDHQLAPICMYTV
jgi:hypothetical protein